MKTIKRHNKTILNNSRPCPYCNALKMTVELVTDKMSSWVECKCDCGAILKVDVDIYDKWSSPCPSEKWKQQAHQFWNDEETYIHKSFDFKKG